MIALQAPLGLGFCVVFVLLKVVESRGRWTSWCIDEVVYLRAPPSHARWGSWVAL